MIEMVERYSKGCGSTSRILKEVCADLTEIYFGAVINCSVDVIIILRSVLPSDFLFEMMCENNMEHVLHFVYVCFMWISIKTEVILSFFRELI